MSSYTEIGGFKYSTRTLSADLESKRLEQTANDLRANAKSRWSGYGAWRAGLLAFEYSICASRQQQQIHGTAFVSDRIPICFCALVADSRVESADGNDKWLYASDGHLDHSIGEVVTAFYINHFSAETKRWSPLLFCQICLATEPAVLTVFEQPDAILLADFRALHKHDKDSEENND